MTGMALAAAQAAAAVVIGSSVGFRAAACSSSSSCMRSSGRTTLGFGSVASSFQRGSGQGGELRQTKAAGWFKFGSNGLDSEGAGIYGSQGRDDFDRDDVEQYFNYMGMLATEGTYDKMEALLNTGKAAVDILLLLAASEADVPKIEELLRAGADCRVTDAEGNTALDRAQDEEIRELILSKSQAKV
ncbi:unnamed protein product [Calypogeia fissa]